MRQPHGHKKENLWIRRKHDIIVLSVAVILVATEVVFTLLTEIMIERIIIELLIMLVAYIAPKLLDISKHRKEIDRTIRIKRKISNIDNAVLMNNVRTYMDNAVSDLDLLITRIGGGTAHMDEQQYSRFVKIVFKTQERYDAIDVTMPSKYDDNNPGYLDAHAEALANIALSSGPSLIDVRGGGYVRRWVSESYWGIRRIWRTIPKTRSIPSSGSGTRIMV